MWPLFGSICIVSLGFMIVNYVRHKVIIIHYDDGGIDLRLKIFFINSLEIVQNRYVGFTRNDETEIVQFTASLPMVKLIV